MRVRSAITVIAVLCLFATGASADIEIHEKHRFDARPGATVVIDVSFHSVEVTAQPGNTVDVTVDITFKGDGSSAKSAANDYKPVFKEDGDKLIIRSTRKKGWSWKSVRAKGKVTVQMPPGMNLTIDSSSGSARINGDFGDSKVVFDASSGSLTVDGAMRELHSDVSSGSVRATVSRPLDVWKVQRVFRQHQGPVGCDPPSDHGAGERVVRQRYPVVPTENQDFRLGRGEFRRPSQRLPGDGAGQG